MLKVSEIISSLTSEQVREIYGKYVDFSSGKETDTGCLVNCIFHEDRTPSLSISLSGETKGLFNCFGCSEKGNIFTFLMKQGMKKKEIVDLLKKTAGIDDTVSGKLPLTLKQFREEKKLSAGTIEAFGIFEGTTTDDEGNSIPCVVFPFHKGGEVLYRKRRHGRGGQKFSYIGKGSVSALYLPKEFRNNDPDLIITEGETDCLTMYENGFRNCAGIAGAKTVKQVQDDLLELAKDKTCVHVFSDGDEAADVFVYAVAEVLMNGGYKGNLDVVYPCDFADDGENFKDVSDIHTAGFGDMISGLLTAGKGIEEAVPELRKQVSRGLPKGYAFTVPDGYKIDQGGVFHETFEKTKEGITKVERKILPIPMFFNGFVLIGGQLHIKIGYVIGTKQGDVIFKKSDIAKRYDLISACAEKGIPGVSEVNAKDAVQYFSAAESANIQAEPVTAITSTGWIDEFHYAPFVLPENCISEEQYGTKNSTSWKELFFRHIHGNIRARAIMMSAIGGTILGITDVRNHILYTWGQSQGGKTAIQYATASFFGRPEDVMMSMYGTTVGIEMLAKKRNDMALILDERQVVQKGFGKGQELVEQVVYMIAGGKGKLRGKKDGGMQDTGMWRTVALISGEESLSKDGSQTGVYSRSLPVYGRPFDKKEDAASCYRSFGECYGLFGQWIRYIIDNRKRIRAIYHNRLISVEATAEARNIDMSASHKTYAANAAVTAFFLYKMFGLDEVTADIYATEVANALLEGFVGEKELGYSEKGIVALADWAGANISKFRPYAQICYGEADGEKLFITAEGFRTFCTASQYDLERLKKDWLNSGIIIRQKDGRSTIKKYLNGINGTVRCYEIDFSKADSDFYVKG